MNGGKRIRAKVCKNSALFFFVCCFIFSFAWPRVPLENAQKLIELHRYPEAETLLKKITSDEPSNEIAHFMLGDLYLRFQAYSQAAVEYNTVLSFDSGNVQALVSLGVVYREEGNLKTSLRFFQKAESLKPDSVLVHKSLAALYDLMGDFLSASAEYNLLARIDSKGDAELKLAKLYRRHNDRTGAMKIVRKYLITHPQDGEGWNTLAQVLLERHEDPQGWDASEQAVKLAPRNIEFLLTHAKIALNLKSGKYAKMAASDAKQILSLDPGNTEANRILIQANEILSGRKLRIVLWLFSAALILSLAGLMVVLRRREKQEAQKSQLVENWGRQLEALSNLEEIIEAVFGRCAELFSLPKGMFFVMSRDENQMSCAFTNFKAVLSGSFEVKAEAIPEWHSLLRGRPMTTTQAFRTPSFNSSFPDAKRTLEKQDIRLLVPFFAKNKLLALLALGGISRREFRNRISAIREKVEMGFQYAEKAAMAMENSTLYELSMLDEQTKVFNKRFFIQVLSDEIKRFERYQQPLSLLMIDIDHFKQLNDTYGHQEGDSVLREMAQIFQESVRQGMDTVFRYGGEEFTIILPATVSDKARETAERLRNNIATHSFAGLPANSHVTISLGVATYPDLAKADWELIQAADQALYKSKNEGRNRVSVCEKVIPAIMATAPEEKES